MSGDSQKLDQTVLERLLAAARTPSAPVESEEAADYDWSVPQGFTQEQLERVNSFVASAVTKISEALSILMQQQLQMRSDPIAQHYADQLPDDLGKDTDYSVTVLDARGGACGRLVLPGDLAMEWVGKMLGSSERPTGEQRELSTMESALLADMIAAIVKAFSDAAQAMGAERFDVKKDLERGEFEPPGGTGSEITRITLRQEDASDSRPVSILLTSEALTGVSGAGTAQGEGATSGDPRARMVWHVSQASVVVTAFLGTAKASIKEILALEPGDVLLLQKTINEPIDLSVQGTVVCSGRPVRCEGRYAVQITHPPH